MKTEQPILITSIAAAEDFSDIKNIFIGFDGAACQDGAKALGVLNANTAQFEQAPVTVSGIALVLSADGINIGAKLQSNPVGKAISFSSGEANGYALDSASGADELIRVKLI